MFVLWWLKLLLLFEHYFGIKRSFVCLFVCFLKRVLPKKKRLQKIGKCLGYVKNFAFYQVYAQVTQKLPVTKVIQVNVSWSLHVTRQHGHFVQFIRWLYFSCLRHVQHKRKTITSDSFATWNIIISLIDNTAMIQAGVSLLTKYRITYFK